MKTLIRCAFLTLAVSWTHQALSASYTNPVGIWDIVNSASVDIKIGTKTQTQPIKQTLNQAQYLDNNTYKGYDWSGISGTWQQGTSNIYQIQLDIQTINTSTNTPAYLKRVIDQFTTYATKLYGTAPTISNTVLQSFLDTATLSSDGLTLKGIIKSVAIVNFKDPKTQKATTAKLKITGNYQGIRASAPSTCCTSDDSTANQSKSQKFLTQNAQLAGVTTTPSGLQYKILQKANGDDRKPLATDKVKVSYRGYLPSGQVFDANSGISFALNQVISGWTEGLQLMEVGDYFRFYIPPQMAYGNRSVGNYIKPNTALIFDVILQEIQ